MTRMLCLITGIALLAMGFCGERAAAADQVSVPVLVYHRFGPSVADGMTVTTAVFESQLQWLKANQYTVIPLRALVDYLGGAGPPPPPRSVVITADDAPLTAYNAM